METMRYIAIIILLLPSLGAEEKKYDKLLNYEGVTVREVRKDSVRIMHNEGFATIPIEKLPEDVREELRMSIDGVEEYRERIALEKAEEASKKQVVAINKKILSDAHMQIESATVFQAVDGGILVQVASVWDGTYRLVPQYETRRYSVGTALSGYRTLVRKEFTGNKKAKNTISHDNWLIFVRCDSTELVAGDRFSGDTWADGTFSYTNLLGDEKTVQRYTVNPEDIITKR